VSCPVSRDPITQLPNDLFLGARNAGPTLSQL